MSPYKGSGNGSEINGNKYTMDKAELSEVLAGRSSIKFKTILSILVIISLICLINFYILIFFM